MQNNNNQLNKNEPPAFVLFFLKFQPQRALDDLKGFLVLSHFQIESFRIRHQNSIHLDNARFM